MADTSLDDFFAKKDKSKKSKKKFASSGGGEQSGGPNFDQDAGARKDSSSYQRGSTNSRKDKEKNSNVSSSGGSNHTQKTSEQEDDEWKEVLEKEIDYSGLKIQNLQISELRDEEYEKEKMEERNKEDGDDSWQRDASGPWNKSSGPQTVPTPTAEVPVTPEVKEEEEEKPATSSVYVAPSMRAGGASSLSHTASRHRSKHAPEISDEMHFPSLSSAADGRKKGYPSPDADRGFESVRRGGSRTVDESGSRGPKLDLGNKYDALSSGETS